MTESEFFVLADMTLNVIEAVLEAASVQVDIDIECSRSGNVLEIEFVANGTKIIVNSQAPMQQMWVAAKSGGFHYKRAGLEWINTRDGSEMFSALSVMVSDQSGADVILSKPS